MILGAKSFRNEYDGHTIKTALEQVERLTGKKIGLLAEDRGYRGGERNQRHEDHDSRYSEEIGFPVSETEEKRLFRKRAGIEPTIGHLKSDYRLNRNFYKGVTGDAVNLLLAAAAYNFKRAMNVLLCLIKLIQEIGFCKFFYPIGTEKSVKIRSL